MKVSVTCRQCKETFDFETDEKKELVKLFKKFEPIQSPEIFVKECPYCGTLNEVKVPVRK